MSSRRVLIVDDDPFIRKLIAATLRDVADFELIEAEDGVVALEHARAAPPALVFLDIDMPRMDGVTACRTLRDSDHGAGMTIVMLTAAATDEARRASEQAGADRFLTKPFSPLDLLRLVDGLDG